MIKRVFESSAVVGRQHVEVDVHGNLRKSQQKLDVADPMGYAKMRKKTKDVLSRKN